MRFLILSLLFFSSAVFAAQSDDGWYSRKTEGWYFYQDPPPDPEKIEEEPKPLPPPGASQSNEPPQFSSAWIKKNLPQYMNAAIDNPSDENILAYFYLQKLAMDKSSRFKEAAARVISGNYDLDQNNRRSLSTFGAAAQDQLADSHKKNLLQKISSRAGIFYFFDSTSTLSNSMDNVVSVFSNSNSFHVTPISRYSTPSSVYQEYLPDSGHSELMNVQAYPTVALMTPEGNYDLVSQNAVDVVALSDRVIESALRLGLISDSDYQSVNRYKVRPSDIPPIATETSLPVDPNSIINSLRTK